ncbi:MAG: putative lipopolysaccharide biosynthesis O-acetyl transferase WbbJ [Segetibacter sp.]|nr:putative lipopolysaccharide biosynthesis O-acetyl transferase WbbJ [Segetibacter sp.]
MRKAYENVKTFFNLIGYLSSFIFPKGISFIIRSFFNCFYSGWIKASLKSYGKNFNISYPLKYRGLKHICVGNNFSSFSNLQIEAYDEHLTYSFTPELIIGDNVSINFDCHIGCINKIVIGNNVLIASKVFITDHYHGGIDAESIKLPPSKRKVFSKGPVVIEDNVWIGEGVAIMPGVTIGENSIIGANAVVTKTFPRNSVIGGIPAKLIKTLGN